MDDKIHHAEKTLKDLRKLQDQISTKTAQRSTLFKEQQKQYAALDEENEGVLTMVYVLPSFSQFSCFVVVSFLWVYSPIAC